MDHVGREVAEMKGVIRDLTDVARLSALHETLNMAALWRVPMIFVCENNGWSEFSPMDKQFSGSLAGLASTFNIQHDRIDGKALEAVVTAADKARAHANESGPITLECMTTRFRGHFEGDPQKYRDESELREHVNKDPINYSTDLLTKLGVEGRVLDGMVSSMDSQVAAAQIGRALLVREGSDLTLVTYGAGAEIAATIGEICFGELDAPVGRVGAPFMPVPYSPGLEKAYIPDAQNVIQAIRLALE